MTLQGNDISGWNILLVDDEQDNLRPVIKVLEHLGARVMSAADGTQALETIPLFQPTLILLDLSMPGMDGWELIKLLRSSPDTNEITVIAVTAHAMVGDEQRALAAGFDAVITKPFRPSVLFSLIKKSLQD